MIKKMIAVILICLFYTSAGFGGEPLKAGTLLFDCSGESPEPMGTVTLVERISDEGVKIVDVSVVPTGGLTEGKHAVHIHEQGSCSPCSDALGHFDPGPDGNSNPDGNHPFHLGDLINLDVVEGIGVMQTSTNRVTLSPGPISIFDENGSAIIIHTNPDTYCPDGVVQGCAGGSREACGIIYQLP